jgi:hypothetical protein
MPSRFDRMSHRPNASTVYFLCTGSYFRHCRLPFLKVASSSSSVKLIFAKAARTRITQMEVSTPKATRRSTRIRVEIPITATSMDRRHPFAEVCIALVVSPQGCGLRASHALPLETPVLLSDLPGGGSASARVANCLPLGNDGKYFLIGVSLYNHGNVWKIPDPPSDWDCASDSDADSTSKTGKAAVKNKEVWPYNLFSGHGKTHPKVK